MSVLIVGGTSGLGLELARDFIEEGDEVVVTGRHDPQENGIEHHQLNLGQAKALEAIVGLVMKLPDIKTLVYGPSYFREGRVTELSIGQIKHINTACSEGLMVFVKKLLHKQEQLPELITITSTSPYTPQGHAPVYSAASSAAAMYSNAMEMDPDVGKVLVADPMEFVTHITNNGEGDERVSCISDVAEKIMETRQQEYRYKSIKVSGNPIRVEEVEER